MADGVTLKLTGDKELIRALNILPDKINQRVTANAIRAGARVVLQELGSNILGGRHIVTGNLFQGISVRSKWYRTAGVFAAYIGSKHRLAPHLHLLEKGHGGPAPAPPHPVLAPAFDSKSNTARAKIEKTFRRGVAREAARLPKGPAR